MSSPRALKIAPCIRRVPLHTSTLMPDSAPILTKQDVAHCIGRLAENIRESCSGNELALVGIYRRGVPLAERVFALLKPHFQSLLLGRVDITLYRDDLKNLEMMPKLVGSDIPFDLDGKHVILFDEVIYTGRTSRAGLDELLDHGRPKQVQIAALIDRGGRELPLHADFVGETLNVASHQRISVCFEEVDGEDAVYVREGGRR
ncbi:MAG: bifunctional pyr operon transcriptional regulator/uracil phosphoribosyltransferase PyrR [Verrucomicrobia bacterium]|nr:bifunctional pyr operon transcriptional regulator/uracil phosphoribosyltransferase PyrR [Verrucomicrobiota bacterium]